MKYLIDKKNISGIYKITNIINNKYYVGSAYNLYKRYVDHKSAIENNRHHNKQISRFVKKYGIDKLKFELIEYCDIIYLESKEQEYINNSKYLFNESKNVKSPNRGKKLSQEHKRKISESIKSKNIIRSQITKNKISKANKGKAGKYERTDDMRKILSEKIKNNLERGKKISNSLKGRKITWKTNSKKIK